MDPRVVASQKRQDIMSAFWPRRLSPYITLALVRTPITPNQTTVLWGVINLLNSVVVYLAMTGAAWLVPIIPLVYVLTFILDCVDGEIARYKNMANPIGGKLLDGICHRATEYSLLVAFSLAAYAATQSWLALAVSALLFSGDAMHSYVYERRLITLRQDLGFSGHIKQMESGMYERGAPWSALTPRQKLRTVTGQLHYKSVYPVVALSYVSASVLLAGLVALGFYKHMRWIRLVSQTLREVARADSRGREAAGSAPAVTTEGGVRS